MLERFYPIKLIFFLRNMELLKAFQINVDYKDRRTPLNWDSMQFSEIIFVDKTHSANFPLVYQLNDQKLTLDQILSINRASGLSFSRDSFMIVGEVLSIDKKKKQILLTNRKIIVYTHLIIASGTKPLSSFQDKELAAALQALTDALRMKSKIPTSFPTHLKRASPLVPARKNNTFFAVSDKPTDSDEEHSICKIVHPYIISSKQKFNSLNLDTLNSRFYEVQT